jgi:DNA/RNA endonuclease YhcR with UshA esterase domain
MKTIAQQLNIKDFPFEIRDKNGNRIYVEASNGYWLKRECDSNGNITYMEASNGDWVKKEYDSNGNRIYVEDSEGKIIDNRPKSTCEGKIVEIDGKKYQLKEVK